MTKLYISGPIGSDPLGVEHARQAFADAADLLKLHSYEVINPFDVGGCPTGDCVFNDLMTRYPEQTSVLVAAGTHTWACYLRYDLIAMLDCTGVANLDGWQSSPGSTLENAVAIQVGISCFPLEHWLSQ